MSYKRDNFVRLAESRVNKALKDLQLVGNLSNRSNYEYNDADVRKIFRALQQGLDAAKQRYADAGGESQGAFKL
jgi:hypothetical protein